MMMVVAIQTSIFTELAEFLVSQPSLEAIVAYKVPDSVQHPVDELLEKNQAMSLSPDERLELEKILAVVDVLDLA